MFLRLSLYGGLIAATFVTATATEPNAVDRLLDLVSSLNGIRAEEIVPRLASPTAGSLPTAVAPAAKGKPERVVTDKDRDFWSFRPLARVTPPNVDSTWRVNEVDRFILAKLAEKKITPNAEVDKRTLIRRAYFDVAGLPPTPEQVNAFLADGSPDAYEKLVDELLASPHYGETWGRHWLDVARYADSDGYEFDAERPTAYHYRDFVIRALNDGMPFDQFVKWQLAGDEYAPEDPLAHAATGFCTAGPTIDNQVTELNRYNELDDMVATTASTFLGLTLACARCHDHKYDPFPSRDYYRMLTAFTSTERHESFLSPRAETDAYLDAKREWEGRFTPVRKARDEFIRPFRAPVREKKVRALEVPEEHKRILLSVDEKDRAQRIEYEKIYSRELGFGDGEAVATLSDDDKATWKQLSDAINTIEREAPKSPPTALALRDAGREPNESFLLARGNPDLKSETIQLGFLSVLPGANDERFERKKFCADPEAKTTYQRTALAEWLTDAEHGAGGLTARVIVNRLWQHHFGRGIVGTPNDFGAQGERPTHPDLLDWLANELIRNGWRLKPVHKLIMMSAAYRQSSEFDQDKATADPSNALYWRRDPQRLQAEEIRDATLAVSGCLNSEMFGPAIKPWMDPAAIATGSTSKWPKDVVDGPETWRRSVYVAIRRSVMVPMFESFDAPDTMASCARRNTTTVPAQALHLMNSPFTHDQARRFAERIHTEAGDDVGAFVERAYKVALSRHPSPTELDAAVRFISQQTQSYPGDDASARAQTDFCQVVLGLNEYVYVN